MSSVKVIQGAVSMEEAFPEVDPGVVPLGTRVLVQIMRAAKMTKSGIILAAETQETDKWNIQVAKVIALGPLAFRNRETKDPWPEGIWAKIGDFVRIPRWNGDRIEVPVDGQPTDPIMFVTFNDHDILGKYTRSPLEVPTYYL